MYIWVIECVSGYCLSGIIRVRCSESRVVVRNEFRRSAELVHLSDICYVLDERNSTVETVVESGIDRSVNESRTADSVEVVDNQDFLF